VEHLQRQLNARLVVARESLEEGTFCLLDYAIEFVRFISSKAFEFVVVSRIHLSEENWFVGIVAQVSLTAQRIVHVMKSVSQESSSRNRCARLVQARRRGYECTDITKLTNEAVIAGKPIEQIENPVLPFEIVWTPPSQAEEMIQG